MAIELNHTIIPARDGKEAATWFATLFGLPTPTEFGFFWQVRVANGVDLDFDTYGPDDGIFTTGHYAFLVTEEEFDTIFGRIRAQRVPHWSDPGRTNADAINHHDGGRGVYFASPDDHLLEIITRPYQPMAPAMTSSATLSAP